MYKYIISALFYSLLLSACNNDSPEKVDATEDDKTAKEEIETPQKKSLINDSLNALINISAGIKDDHSQFNWLKEKEDFKTFSSNFDQKWLEFTANRLTKLIDFRKSEIDPLITQQSTLFYPFSGPDILYAQTFFPKADKYVLLGLEPVGSLPIFSENTDLKAYFNKVNTSLHAILNYSFFRTKSMHNDLRNQEVDGTLHLILLFLKRQGNLMHSVEPIKIDSTGQIVYLNDFKFSLNTEKETAGVEIKFEDKEGNPKSLFYYSLNAADGALATNKGFVNYINNLGEINTYLKGATYLMHKSYFSQVRNAILKQSKHVVQDDSGIALKYFTKDQNTWTYAFFGEYTKPINLFSNHYQKDLDSLYKTQGSKDIGFGIGYNFMDKNSNFMVITKK